MADHYTDQLLAMLRHRGHDTATLHVEAPGLHCCPIAYCEWRTPVQDDTAALGAIARHLDRSHPLPHQGEGEFGSWNRT
jgi:hypothetical protein